MELGYHSWMVCLAAKLFINSSFSGHRLCDFVSCSCRKSKLRGTQVAWHWRGPHLLNTVVLAVADGLFALCGSEHRSELFIGIRHPRPPSLIRPLLYTYNLGTLSNRPLLYTYNLGTLRNRPLLYTYTLWTLRNKPLLYTYNLSHAAVEPCYLPFICLSKYRSLSIHLF